MTRSGCSGAGVESLCSRIARANTCGFRSKTWRILRFLIVVFVVAACILATWADKNCVCIIIAAFYGLFFSVLGKGLYFMKAEELSYGLACLATANWRYMELWFNDRKNYSFFFGRIMRSPAFIMIAGFYYQLKVGDSASAAKLLAIARERAPELKAIEMSPGRGLLQKEREALVGRLRKDLGVVWFYKNRKSLWAAVCILDALMSVGLILALVRVTVILIKGAIK